ncbi:MAG TPA: glycosyltransferase family A protein [Bryobacteraceae bacterium]|nr:glycosyltransferase family A protein [Bryobacteraceae bacterium]
MSVSVIIPVYNSAAHLKTCLSHLAQWPAGPLELIVVDDGSTDGSAEVARSFNAVVLSTGGRKGPARARNIGARAARGEILLFIDSDVCVHPDTLERVREDFRRHPELDALIGSYDSSPQSPDFISQYKNLMHSYVHQRGRLEACTFWSGCGAIRRQVFLEHAGFDESYGRPAIEDIELGYRLRQAGRNMVLDKDLQVTHLKKWTFWSLLKTDVLDRGIPWTELILRDHYMPNDLNLELSQRVSVALAFLLVGLALAAAVLWNGLFLTPVLALLVFLLAAYWLEFASGRPSPAVLAGTGIVVLIIVWMALAFQMTPILPPLLLGCLLLLLRHRYACASARKRQFTGVVLAVYILGAIAYFLTHMPRHPLIFAVFLVAAAIVVVNNQFYTFLAAKQGRLFALAAVPFHLLYHLYNGISFAAGVVRFYWRKLARRPAAPSRNSAVSRR